MNEQFKMSDVFECKLPLKVNGYMIFQKENSYYSNVCESVNERVDYLVAIAIAVNEYDQHLELIAKQAEQIKMLRDALLLSVPYLNFNSMEESKAEQALSATEQK